MPKTTSHEEPPSPLTLVCSSCRAGPFSHKGFRQAVAESHNDQTTGYVYMTTWSEISQSVSIQGCSWCRLVIRTRDGLPADKFPYGQETVEVRLQVSAGKVRKAVEIFLNGYKAVTYMIYANAGDTALAEIGTEFRMWPKELYVDYQKALECIKECSTHEHCTAIEETYLPTRVIDCSDPSKPRLFETHRQIKGYYATLSYVWGGDQPQKLTTANIDTYIREGINVPLSQTVSDAISATNKLEVKYLWVDALCIIQDSDEDKDRELGNMANIYRDAYVTLSVLSAFRANQGFLPDERVPDVLPFLLADRSVAPGRMLLEYELPLPPLGQREWPLRLYSPLDERGWCMQESALSPRRLIFQPPKVFYKCPSFTEVEITQNRPGDPADDYIIFPNSEGGSEASEEELRARWLEMLEDYTKRKITVASDKFVALASIAEVFQSLLEDEYIAGLWKQNILFDLLWQIWTPMGPGATYLPRPEGYRAPSWSWASVDGRLDTFYPQPPTSAASYEAEILTCMAMLKNPDLPFGEITAATLTMKVKMHPLMLDARKCSLIGKQETRTGHVDETTWYWNPPAGHCLLPKDVPAESEVAGIKLDSLEGTEQDRERNFFVIILRAGREWRNQGDWMQGLLVVPVDGAIGQYRRVAMLNLQFRFRWLDWFDDMPLTTITLI